MFPTTAIILVSLLLSVVDAHQSRPRAVHQGLAKRVPGEVGLFKRFSSTRWTFYDVGLGACGETNVASDFIVALNADQFGSGYPGPNCFKTITMTYNGKSAQATVMDRCPGCPYGGLDLSRGLFDYFASEDLGVITGDWVFNDDSTGNAAAAATTTAKAAVTTTTKAAAATTKTTKAATPTTTTKAATTKAATPATTTKARANTATTKAATTTKVSTTNTAQVTSTSSTHRSVNQAAASVSHTASKSMITAKSSSASLHRSTVSASKASSANLASTFSSVLPSASAAAGSTSSTNTTAQIQENLQAISVLLTKLGKLIASSLGSN